MGTAVGPAAAAALGLGACLLGFLDFLPIGHCLCAAHAAYGALVRCDGVEAVGDYKALRVSGAYNACGKPRELDGAMPEMNVDQDTCGSAMQRA